MLGITAAVTVATRDVEVKEIGMTGRTMELAVDDASFMLEKFGQDCEPLQFLRELTENGVQAVKSTARSSGEVIWDLDWASYEADGLVKLCCIDTGVGMTGEELKRYINQLSASRHQQRIDGNYGVGAKVAAAPRNPAGLIYVSWKDGVGHMVQLWRDPESRRWGLKQFPLADGSFAYAVPVDDAVKPESLRGSPHGTMVVLLGEGARTDTMQPPAGAENRHHWMAQYLNQRYFCFPEGVKIKVREEWDAGRVDAPRGFLRTVRGQEHYLRRHSFASGSEQLTDAVAHWWILDERHQARAKQAVWASMGHRAALFQDELYELVSPSRGGYQKVQEFGIRFGYARVVIYVESQQQRGRVAATYVRSELKIDGQPLPWARWGQEFASQMPMPIRELEERLGEGSIGKDAADSIRKRLQPLRDLFKISRYRPHESGEIPIGPSDFGGKPARRERDRPGTSPSGGDGGTDGNVYALFQSPLGQPGERIEGDNWPRIDWVSAHHTPPTRTPPHLEDRAARYDRQANRLEINEDFRLFVDSRARWSGRYASVPGSKAVVEAAVREWYAQTLVETVLGALGLQGSAWWDDADSEKLLSQEALTAAVQPRYLLEQRLNKDLTQRLGQPGTRAA